LREPFGDKGDPEREVEDRERAEEEAQSAQHVVADRKGAQVVAVGAGHTSPRRTIPGFVGS
jgi:hypothetical protein